MPQCFGEAIESFGRLVEDVSLDDVREPWIAHLGSRDPGLPVLDHCCDRASLSSLCRGPCMERSRRLYTPFSLTRSCSCLFLTGSSLVFVSLQYMAAVSLTKIVMPFDILV